MITEKEQLKFNKVIIDSIIKVYGHTFHDAVLMCKKGIKIHEEKKGITFDYDSIDQYIKELHFILRNYNFGLNETPE